LYERCTLSEFLPQIADSSILQPVFKFDEDTLTSEKNDKDTVDSSNSAAKTVRLPLDTPKANHRQEPINTTRNTVSSNLHTSLNNQPQNNIPEAEKDSLINNPDTVAKDSLVKIDSNTQQTATEDTSVNFLRTKGIVKQETNNLFFITELILVLSIVLVRIYQQRLFRKFIYAAFSLSLLQDLEKESKTFSTPVFFVGFLNYIVQAAIFTHFYLTKDTFFDFVSIFQLGSIIFIFNIAKYLFYRISGVIFDQNDLFANYGLYHFVILILSGIIFLIINILYVYTIPSAYLLIIGIGIFSILLIFKYVTFVLLSVNQKVSGFHIFLYLCTLEILPFIVAYNWFNL